MFDRFTQRARRVMEVAMQEARDRYLQRVDTEHVVWSLLRDETGTGCRALIRLQHDPMAIRQQVETLMGSRTPGSWFDDLRARFRKVSFSPQARRLLELALEEASELHHDWIGTEHLLLGTLREPDGVAGRVLSKNRVSLESARRAVAELTIDARRGPHR